MEERTYKVFREENGKIVVDMFVHIKDGKIDLKEEVNKIDVKGKTVDEINELIAQENFSEEVRLDIKRGIHNRMFGYLELELDNVKNHLNLSKTSTEKELTEGYEEVKKNTKSVKEELVKELEKVGGETQKSLADSLDKVEKSIIELQNKINDILK